MKHLLTPLLRPAQAMAVTCLLFSQCSHQPKTTASAKPVEWYVAQQEPLTYCPKGYQLPAAGGYAYDQPLFVYVGDRKMRYYIPRNCVAHREEALRLRKASHPTKGDHDSSTVRDLMATMGVGLMNTVGELGMLQAMNQSRTSWGRDASGNKYQGYR